MTIRALLASALLAAASLAGAQAFDTDAFSTDAFSEEAFWFSGEPPDPVTVFQGGRAFDGNGRLRTAFLADAQAVPSSAVFIGGIAYNQAGARYVAAWPDDDAVVYIAGVAVRPDGAMVVSADGTAAASIAGIAFTARGEVLVTEDNPDVYVGGLGMSVDGELSVTNSD